MFNKGDLVRHDRFGLGRVIVPGDDSVVICPASLVEQWQYRLLSQFDIRLTRYLPELDTGKSGFWKGTHLQVVASLHTLRKDEKGRWNRLAEAEPWDMVVVDEAHHLNAD